MKFKMNDLEWTIRFASPEEIKADFGDTAKESYYFGITRLNEQYVLINNEISKEQQRITLYHELMHCYIFSYIIGDGIQFDEEGICNISSKSHNMIHKITDDFFKKVGDKKC